MADKTFGFKVTDEVYEKAKLLIETSGLSSRDWFENALATYEVKALQTNAPEYTRNLNELELHTTRIYELVVNMVQQSMYFKDQAVREVSEQLEKKEQLLAELQEKLQATKQSVQTLQADKDELTTIQSEQQKQLDEARTAIENSQLLIAEYKDKNDSLTGLVTKYQGYAEEKEKAEQATALLQERHELALERAIVKAEREYQEKLQAQLDTYNTRITELQAENDRIRASYENRLEELLKSNEKKK